MNNIRVSGCVLKSLQSCSTLCNPMNCRPPGSCVHGVLQAEILGWVAMPSSRGSSRPRDWTWCISVTARYPMKLRENGLNLLALKLFPARSRIQKRSWLKSRQKARQGRGVLASTSACLSLPTIPRGFLGASWSPYAILCRPQHRAHGQAQSSTRAGLNWREAFQVALNNPVSGCYHESITLLACCGVS